MKKAGADKVRRPMLRSALRPLPGRNFALLQIILLPLLHFGHCPEDAVGEDTVSGKAPLAKIPLPGRRRWRRHLWHPAAAERHEQESRRLSSLGA